MIPTAESSIAFATIYSILLVLTACGCFLVGVNLMSKGFVHLSSKNNSFFARIFCCKNRFQGIGAGIVHSAVTQSSDATAVSLIRLVDIGAITFFQAACAIIGANIGTTLTAFIVSLSAFNLTPYLAFLAFIGAIPLLSSKRKNRTFGEIVGGFGILFIGLELLSNNMENEFFRESFKMLFGLTSNPILLILIGMGVTMIVQSSSVVTSLVIFFCSAAVLPLDSALYLVMGANIGTSVTSWFASIGGSRNARRTALFHTLFNVIGTIIIFLIVFFVKEQFFGFVESVPISVEFKVAFFHLFFNLITAIIIVPFIRPLVWLCKKIVRH